MSGCVTERKRAKICLTCPVKTTDSTRMTRTETIRDTIIRTDSDSAKMVIRFLPCPDGSTPKLAGTDLVHGRKTTIKAKQNGLQLDIAAQVKPEEKTVAVKDTHTTTESKRTEQLPCPEHSHWMYWLAIGVLSTLAIFGWVRR